MYFAIGVHHILTCVILLVVTIVRHRTHGSVWVENGSNAVVKLTD